MTDEERQKLLGNLRMVKFAAPTYAKQWCDAAADEIERLAKEVKDAKELVINLLNKAKEYMDD